eukprot:scaffold2507_cov122-Isochrysis_galbana.AAC.9
MEQLPADARAAPSASEPNDTVMDIHASPKRPRESAQGNMVSQSATSTASALPEPYEEARSSLYEKSKLPAPKERRKSRGSITFNSLRRQRLLLPPMV